MSEACKATDEMIEKWQKCVEGIEKDRWAAHQHAENKQRRERIATAIMPALINNAFAQKCCDAAMQADNTIERRSWIAAQAVIFADALIAELDREQPQEMAE